jgi:integrase
VAASGPTVKAQSISARTARYEGSGLRPHEGRNPQACPRLRARPRRRTPEDDQASGTGGPGKSHRCRELDRRAVSDVLAGSRLFITRLRESFLCSRNGWDAARDVPRCCAKPNQECCGSRLSARMVQFIHAVLRNALQMAVREEIVSRNVAKLVKVSAPKYKVNRGLTVDQARAVLEAAKSERLNALYVLALCLGLRRGELFGLRWDDVHLAPVRRAMERAALRTARSARRAPGAASRAPRSKRSRRSSESPENCALSRRRRTTRSVLSLCRSYTSRLCANTRSGRRRSERRRARLGGITGSSFLPRRHADGAGQPPPNPGQSTDPTDAESVMTTDRAGSRLRAAG